MDANLIYEIIGYGASFITLISMSMSNVVKLRIINCIGCAAFIVYALLIQSYPILLLNLVILIINIYHLYKLKKTK